MDLHERFEQFDSEYLKFENIAPERVLSCCRDLNALLLLERILSKENRHGIISGSDHEIVYIGVDVEALNAVASDEDIKDLRRSGVHYDSECECLAMFT